MVGKKFISRVMEEFLGEYILNISEENLKLGIVRGKLKLDNVQLDGDLIGSHILGVVGLSGFGILSCTAMRLSATIPWGKLEKEPTRFELSALNIICVPLLPSNADRMFGAGTKNDPKCTLKTRAKRSVLARFERNFFSWRIPGEGPPRPNQNNRGSSGEDINKSWDCESQSQRSVYSGTSIEDSHVGPDQDGNGSVSSNGQLEENDASHENTSEAQQNTWRRKLVLKMFRNIEVKICDIHLRCEVSEGSLNLEPTRTHHKSESNSKDFSDTNMPSDQRSFAFGFTIDSLVIKSANSEWQTGNIDWNTEKKCTPKRGNNVETPQVGDDEKRYKVLQAKKLSMYWDDNPPVLISDCHILNCSDHMLSSNKCLTRIRLALEIMGTYQDPGEEILNMLEGRDIKKINTNLSGPCKEHDYCLSPSSLELRITLSNIDQSGPTQCFAELLPCHFDLQLRPHQVQQYKTLRNMTIAQQRLDTMLHQRPHSTPSEDPRAWWRYIISCVVTRPNVRPWRDVLQITSRRSRYIELVMKKILSAQKGGGFHGGLAEEESLELIRLEDLLPIEALLSFHLVALRNMVDLKKPTAKAKTPKMRSRKKSTEMSLKSLSISRRTLFTSQRTPLKQRKCGDDTFEDTISLNNSIISTSSFESDSYTPERRIRFVQIPKSPLKYQSPLSSPRTDIGGGGASIRNTIAPISFFATELRSSEIAEKSTKSPPKQSMGSRKSRSLRPKSKYGNEHITESLSILSFDEESRKLDRFLDKQKGGIQSENNNGNEGEVNENPPMHITFQIQIVSLTVVLLEKSSESPILQADIQASGCVENSGTGTTLLFDLKNVEVKDCMHNMTKFLTFHDALNTRVIDTSLFNSSSKKLGSEDEHVQGYSSLSLEKLKEVQKKAFAEYLLLQTNTDVPLPPRGVVCRLLASASSSGLSLTISACAATLIWNTAFLKTVADSFFPGRPSEMRVLHRQLRNAATPLAHKTQLALTSPNFLSLRINIDAPKLWFPISPKVSDGALFVDAGRLKMSLSKPEQVTTLHWVADSTKIQVKFVRGLSRLFTYDNIESCSPTLSNSREDIPVILPFDIHLTLDKIGEGPTVVAREDVENSSNTSETFREKSSKLKIRFSKISLNLVDVEVLAKAIGNWYATQLLSVKRRGEGLEMRDPQPSFHPSNNHTICLSISVSIKSIEMMLEGQQTFLSSNEKNQKYSSIGERIPKRTYKVQILGIFISRNINNCIRNSHLKVNDIRIVQMGRKCKGRLKETTNSSEFTHHQILAFVGVNERKKLALSRSNLFLNHLMIPPKDDVRICGEAGSSPWHSAHHHISDLENYEGALTATLLQDESNHINDVDIDLNYLCIHITPTSLSDFSKALSRILELIEITTREMERRVHETGRTARIVGCRKSCNKSLVEDDNTSLCKEISCEKVSTDSSLLVKVNLKDASLFATWPIVTVSSVSCAKNRSEENIDDVVVQIFSSALIMFQSIENTDASGTKTTHVSIDSLSSSIGEELKPVPGIEVPPIIGPFAAEFRLVSSTVDSGTVVSQDSSLDFDSVKASVTPRDLRILICVCQNITCKLQSIVARRSNENEKTSGILSLFHYRKKGTAVAASIRLEVQPFSIVLLHSLKKSDNRKPLFDLKGRIRGKLQGCASAMAGDIRCDLAVNFFNPTMSDWESVFEPSFFLIEVEQLPNEVMFNISTSHLISSNLTSSLLATLAEMNFDVFDNSHRLQSVEDQSKYLPYSNPGSTKKYKDAKESLPSLVNESGLDILICPMDMVPVSDQGVLEFNMDDSASLLLENGGVVPLSSQFRKEKSSKSILSRFAVAIAIAPTSERLIGKRNAIFHLPIHFDGDVHISKHRLECSEKCPEYEYEQKCTLEPVVEWCMQNQRLGSAYLDTYFGKKGLDHLSSVIWSPGDHFQQGEDEQYWVQPYLDGDPQEWTDMTCLFPISRERAILPNWNWVWANDWTVDLAGDYGETIDADGWEYAETFEAFGRTRRFYKINDACRRRKWTRTRLIIPPKPYDPLCPLLLVWKCSIDSNGNQLVKIRSKLTIRNLTASNLSFFVSSVSWEDEKYVGTAVSGGYCIIPAQLSSATYLRLAKTRDIHVSSGKVSMHDYFCSERNMILPTSHISCSTLRTSINLTRNRQSSKEPDQSPTLHFLLQIKHTTGLTEVLIEPALKIINLLPCQLQYRLYEKLTVSKDKTVDRQIFDEVNMTEESLVSIGQEKCSLAVDPRLKPFVSFRVPGYRWSMSQRIVNRNMSSTTWTASEREKDLQYIASSADKDCVQGYKTLIQFESIIDGGDPLTVILLVDPGHCPSLRIYAQYWIRDKSGFGLKLSDGFSDFTGTTLLSKSNRHSYLSQKVASGSMVRRDMLILGHQWPIGMGGMSLYFSRKEKLAVFVETENEGERKGHRKRIHSNWSTLLDVSNVMPKTVFSVDEADGQRRFELCFNVTVAPSIFSRTKIISIFPRYRIVNLMDRSLNIAQSGCLSNETYLPCHSATPFHLDDGTQSAQVRLSTCKNNFYMDCDWTIGSIHLDKIGITSMRLPENVANSTIVQAEVRLATKIQDSAVVILLWNSNDQISPLYLLRNMSSFEILCSQPLCDDVNADIPAFEDIFTSHHRFTTNNYEQSMNSPKSSEDNLHHPCGNKVSEFVTSGLECGLVDSIPHDKLENHIWSLSTGDDACFGFDDPDKQHILQWTCEEAKSYVARADIDAIGSSSVLSLPGGQRVRCQIRAENSSKVIEFVDIHSTDQGNIEILDSIKGKINHFEVAAAVEQNPKKEEPFDEIEFVVMKIRFDIPSLSLSVIDNTANAFAGREILHLRCESLMVQLSQNRDGYHELELRVMSLQVDNHVQNAIHPILVSFFSFWFKLRLLFNKLTIG